MSTTYLHKTSHKTNTWETETENDEFRSDQHGANWVLLIGQMFEIQKSQVTQLQSLDWQKNICHHCHFPSGRLNQDGRDDSKHFGNSVVAMIVYLVSCGCTTSRQRAGFFGGTTSEHRLPFVLDRSTLKDPSAAGKKQKKLDCAE